MSELMSRTITKDNDKASVVDLRSMVTGVGIYTKKGVANKEYADSGTVDIDTFVDVSGADEVYLITGGAFPATTVTVTFYRGEYKDATGATAVSVPLGTAEEFASTSVTVPNAGFSTRMKVTCSFTGGDYELFLGKKGLS